MPARIKRKPAMEIPQGILDQPNRRSRAGTMNVAKAGNITHNKMIFWIGRFSAAGPLAPGFKKRRVVLQGEV